MKGKTLIQLFNAETGEEEARLEDNNIVTDYMKDFLNKRVSAFNSNLNAGLDGDNNNTLYRLNGKIETFFRGLVLFGDTLTAGVGNYNLDFVPEVIGYAAGDYSGADSYRGDYNAAESGKVGNVWTQVWDFGTDKANGIIRTACLTDEIGATSAYGTEEGYQDLYEYPFNTPFTSGISSSLSVIKPTSFNQFVNTIIGKITTGGKDYLYYTNASTVYRFELDLDGYEITPIDYEAEVAEIVGSVPLTSPYNYQSMFSYAGVMYILEYNSSTADCLLSVVDPVTLAKSGSVSINVTKYPNFSYNKFACIINGELWMLSQAGDAELTSYSITTGLETGSFDISYMPTHPNNLNKVTDKILMVSDRSYLSGQYNCRTYKFDGTRISLPTRNKYYTAQARDIVVYDYDDILSFVQTSESGDYMNIGLKLGLLTTINVLPSPVTKLNTQTMKVTYTLTY